MSTDQQEGAETTTSEVQVCPGNGNGNETPEQPKGTDAGAEGTEGTGGEKGTEETDGADSSESAEGRDEITLVDEAPIKLTADQVEELKKEAREVFDFADADKDGFIVATEIEDLYRSFNHEGSYVTYTDDELKELGAEFIKIGDANGDGKVSFDEFFNALLRDSGYEA